MGKREAVLFLSIGLMVVISFFVFVSVNYFPDSLVSRVITGNVIGTLSLYVSGGSETVTIYTPADGQTYGFGIGDDYNFTLSASADFPLAPTLTWTYSLYDVKHGVWTETNTYFTPNSSNITANRWANILVVSARDDDNNWHNGSITFNVTIPNTSPIIEDIADEFFVCEGDKTSLFSFNGSDVDEEGSGLEGHIHLEPSLADGNFFYISPSNDINDTLRRFFVRSVNELSKEDIGKFSGPVSIEDNGTVCEACSDEVNLTVIEINNPPTYEDIWPQKIYLSGDNATFYKDWEVEDIEADDYNGTLTYNISFETGPNLFEINSSTGVMNFTPTAGQKGTYSIIVCVNDTGLIWDSHENFSVCGDRSNDSISVCDSFTLEVSNDSRSPEILSYSPLDLTLETTGTSSNVFNVSAYDPDGSILSINWYVDGVLSEHNEGILEDEFIHSFGYDVGGSHEVSVNVTDGLNSDSVTWVFDVTSVSSPSGGSGGGSGGGSLSGECSQNWVCGNWGVCQNVKNSFDAKVLSPEDFSDFKELCAQNRYDERFCGFQITNCVDLSECNNSILNIPSPSEKRICYFTKDPSCTDGITNCHDGSCEILVDCGGPCSPCPTCYDRKRNQGESGIDCGGPCPWACESEMPFSTLSVIIIILLIVLVAVILFIAVKVVKIIRYRHSKRKR
jgi:hypothetical protein